MGDHQAPLTKPIHLANASAFASSASGVARHSTTAAQAMPAPAIASSQRERRRLEREVCECAAFTGQDVRGQAGMLPRDRTLHARTRAGSDPAIHGCRGGIPESTMQRTVRPGSGIYPPGPGRPPA